VGEVRLAQARSGREVYAWAAHDGGTQGKGEWAAVCGRSGGGGGGGCRCR
jgi:hypothetical protein